MSTMMSTDMHIKRSTTRLHAPPGGKSSITFGDASTTTPPPMKVEAVVTDAKPVVVESEPSKPGNSDAQEVHSIALVVGGGIGADVVVTATVKALSKKLISHDTVSVTRIQDPTLLAHVVRRIINEHEFKTIIAVALLSSDHSPQEKSGVISNALQLVAAGSSVPIISRVLTVGSMLEVKALMPTLSAQWAESVYELSGPLTFESADAPEPVNVPVHSPDNLSVDQLLEILRHSLKEHGANGIFGLGRKFRIADDDRSGSLNLEEFTKVINEHCLNWTPAQIQAVFSYFDKSKNGNIDYEEFLVGVRGVLNPRRQQFVLQAFQILDGDKSGVVEMNDIAAKYDGSKHPDVLAHKRTNEDILREFMGTFDSNNDGKITVAEFSDYYATLSASIDDDDYFELMMRNAWHISGGEGWCANSSCRRILVTHLDGRQTVEEIKNDLGMGKDDKEAMMSNLKTQGIADVLSIDTSGSTEAPSTAPAVAPSVGTAAIAIKPKNSNPILGDADAVRPPTSTKAKAVNPIVSNDEERPATAQSFMQSRGRSQGGGQSSIVFG